GPRSRHRPRARGRRAHLRALRARQLRDVVRGPRPRALHRAPDREPARRGHQRGQPRGRRGGVHRGPAARPGRAVGPGQGRGEGAAGGPASAADVAVALTTPHHPLCGTMRGGMGENPFAPPATSDLDGTASSATTGAVVSEEAIRELVEGGTWARRLAWL